MAVSLNAKRLADRIRQKIEDRSRRTFAADDEILEVADECLESILTESRLAGRGHSRDFLDLDVSDLTQISGEVYSYALPSRIVDVQLLEGVDGDNVPVQIPRADLPLKDAARTRFGVSTPVWHFSRRSGPGTIEIRGRIGNISGFRIYYTRRWPPLFHGTLGGGSTVASLTGWSNIEGRLLKRDDAYNDTQVEVFEDSTNAENVDATSYVSDYAGASQTFTLETALPAVPTSGDTKVAAVVPMEPEHVDYLSELASYKLFQRLGNYNAAANMLPMLQQLEDRFRRGLNQRDTSTQRAFYNSFS